MQRLSVLLLLVIALPGFAENWPEFRGPTGQGHYSGKNLPIEWSKTKNVVWKRAIEGHGWSSPIVQDGRVYLTSAVPVKESKDLSLQAICLDAEKGSVLWQTEVFRQSGAKAPRIHTKNSHASPSPVSDGERLFVHFGHQGTACLDFDGKIVWRNTELRYSPVHGNGGSPILVDHRLVFSVDGSDKQFIAALDKSDGKLVWKTDRKSDAPKKFTFSTPLLVRVKGQEQIISQATNALIAYNPVDGKEIWRVKYDGYSVVPRPVHGHGMIFLSTGYEAPILMAIRDDGASEVTETHVAWTAKKGSPLTPSLLLVGDDLYAVSDQGIASCRDARTGKGGWQERIDGKGFSASPIYADGKIYFQSEDGVTTVIRANSKALEVLATNKLDERTFASYAIANSAIYLRTEKHLYRIQAQSP